MGIEGLKERLEAVFEPVVFEVTKGALQRYVRAIGDASPRWQAAVPPSLVPTIGFEQILQKLLDACPDTTILHGSTDLEYFEPLALGDEITAGIEVTGIRERQGQMGTTAFVTIEINYQNQRQEEVARCRQLIIVY